VPVSVDLEGPTYGGGMTVVGGYGPVFAMADLNYTYTDFDVFDSKIGKLTFSPRAGLQGKLYWFRGAFWLGAMYIDNEQTAADLPAMPQEAAPKKRGRGPGKKQQAEAAAPPEDDTESAEEKAELDELWSQAVELGQRCQRTEEVSMAKADAAMKEGKASLISLIQALEELVIAVERNRP